MRKQTFIKGTMILLAAGVINRLLGFVPRITLPRIIGPEGIGLYQMGYSFMIVVLTVVTSGIPLAVSKLVAEADSRQDHARVQAVLRWSMLLSVGLGFLFTAFCFFGAPWITSHLLTDERVYRTFLSMTPVVPIVAVSSVLRGYYQGLQNMIPTAVSQVTETLGRIVAMLLFAYLLFPYGVEWGAAGAMLGVVFGEVCGMIVLFRQRGKGRRDKTARIGASAVLPRLFSIAVPVTGSRLVGSTSYFLEAVFITQGLAAAGVVTAVATAQYGVLQGMIMPILLLPGALTYSLSISLVPSLSEAAAQGDMKTIHKRLHQSLRLALVTGVPFAVLMFVLAEPICYYMYGNAEIGRMLRMMAPVALFLYFQTPLQATLQALDHPGKALTNTLIGSIVKLILIAYLTSRPQWGIMGAVAAININIVLVTLLHWSSVSRLLRFSMKSIHFLKAGVAAAVMGVIAAAIMNTDWHTLPLLRFFVACLVSGVCYLVMIHLLKLIRPDDFSRIPWIGKK